MVRGGSWNNNPRNLRSANRNRNTASNANNNQGFCLASPPASTGIAGAGMTLLTGNASVPMRVSMGAGSGFGREGGPNSSAGRQWCTAGRGTERRALFRGIGGLGLATPDHPGRCFTFRPRGR